MYFMKSKKIMGVRVDFGLSMEDTIDIIENKLLKDDKNHIVCTTNPEFIIDAQEDAEFRDIINNSSLSVPDGIGVVLANKYLEKIEKFPRNFLFPLRALIEGILLGIRTLFNGHELSSERISGVDLAYKLCEVASKKKYNIFLLGGRYKNVLGKFDSAIDKDMSEDARTELEKLYPGINIVGATSKYSRLQIDDSNTVNFINDVMKEKGIQRIDILLVAYNHGHQEKWIIRNKDKIPAKVSIGCGGTFDYIVRNCALPPTYYVNKNLGWLYRVIKQPWRIKRILKAFPTFPMKIFISSLTTKR